MRHGWLATVPDPLRVVRTDAIAAVIALALGGLLTFTGSGVAAGWPEAVVVVLLFGSLAVRRSAPVTFAMLTAVLAGLTFATTTALVVPATTLALVGVYSAAAFAPRRWHWVGLLPLPFALALLLGESIAVGAFDGADLLPALSGGGFTIAVFLAAWALGYARRGHFQAQAQERERVRLLEQDAHRLAELAVADERTRISREMHDIIAHSLASIITLAEGGRMAAGRDPELGARLFERIGDAGRDALGDVKRLLRNVDEGQDDTPAHGVDELAGLVGTAALGGLPITMSTRGEPRPLPAGLSLAVYRVAQESITNVLKHAPGRTTELRLHWPEPVDGRRADDRGALVLEIENALPDDGRPGGPAAGGSGRGLAGMRERVELFDGEFAANRTGGRFCIRASWPLPA